ncbi:hypothetical protein D3C78_1336520 [compost metagenome]
MAIRLQVGVAEQTVCRVLDHERLIATDAIAPGLLVEFSRCPGFQLLRRVMTSCQLVNRVMEQDAQLQFLAGAEGADQHDYSGTGSAAGYAHRTPRLRQCQSS